MKLATLSLPVLWALSVSAESIGEINGVKFLSPYAGNNVTNVTGFVTAKGPNGIWLRSPEPDQSPESSESIYVFGKGFGEDLNVGDNITIDGKVAEYRSNVGYLFLTEITSPKLVEVVSTGNDVEPLVIGVDTFAVPIQDYTPLDGGNIFKLPNNVTLVSVENPTLQPESYGLDFWESLSGELVTVRKPTAISKPNNFGDTWVTGDWKVTGRNKRGGLTMTPKDANPEAIIIGSPLDGTNNTRSVKLGDSLDDITGVITYAFGFYRILPLTALTVTGSREPATPPPTKLKSTGSCDGLTVAAYNVENLSPEAGHMPDVASQIVNLLQSPDILFLQEVQDNNGPNDDDVVSANLTLSTLSDAIASAGGPTYEFIDVNPISNEDGGEPGGNIRVAYLYNPSILRLYKPNPGDSLDATEIKQDGSLTFNPGRIDPENEAFTDSRKPLAAAWEVLKGNGDGREENIIYTVNVHFSSKGGSSSLEGDARPPVNGAVEKRLAQTETTARFIASFQDIVGDNARIIAAGDFNEFEFVKPIRRFRKLAGMRTLADVVGIKRKERYSYVFDMNSQQLDHMFVTPALEENAEFQHPHLSTWVSAEDEVSDHDPSVARLDVCL